MHCGKNDQWVSHGYTYQSSLSHGRQVAGKRIVCSNRYGRSGCGRTRQLYLNDVIPKRQYRLSVVIAFIQALLTGTSVDQAYRHAIGSETKDTRHAWRWLNDFLLSLSAWRVLASLSFKNEQKKSTLTKRPTRRFAILLPTLRALSTGLKLFQQQFQRAFF